MADGVLITPGVGEKIAADDAGTDGKVQILKLAVSADGSAVVLPATQTDGLLVNLGVNNDVTIGGTATISGSLDPITATTAVRSSVADSAINVTILASNVNRRGATIYNNSTVDLYLGLGTADVTNTDFTHKIAPGGYYEVPFNYTGAIEGLWASDPNTGAALVTELT